MATSTKTLTCFSLLILLSVCFYSGRTGTCKSIHIGTDTKTTGTINDIVSDGVTSKMWKKDSFAPFIVTHSKEIEYFYLVDVDFDLDQTDIRLSYDNEYYANSTVKLKKEAGRKHWYTLEVKYKCEAYGGALLTYKMEVNVPDCGTATFYWKKVCGYPLTPRDGFTVDMYYNSSSKVNVVKNGLPVNENFWDEEIEDWSINIPSDVKSLSFDVYMSTDDVRQAQKARDKAEANATGYPYADATEYDPIVAIKSPKVDSDDAVVSVELIGDLVEEGGNVREEKTTLVLNFECENVKGYSTIEFVLPLENFRDVNLFFYKECDNATSIFSSLIFWIIFIMFGALVYFTYRNITQGVTGLQAVPFGEQGRDLMGSVIRAGSGAVQKYAPAPSSPSTSRGSGHDYEEQGEFKIRNMDEMSKEEEDENKYGTI